MTRPARTGRPTDVPSVVADFIQHIELRGRMSTAKGYHRSTRVYATWLARRGVDVLAATRADIEAFAVYIANDYPGVRCTQLGPGARRNLLVAVKELYRWLQRERRIISDPARHQGTPAVRRGVVRRPSLSLQECTALIQTAAAIVQAATPGSTAYAKALRDLALIALGLATGRRVSGMSRLRLADLDVERSELRVSWEKGHQGRVLPVARWAMDLAKLYVVEARPILRRCPVADQADDRLASERSGGVPWLFLGHMGNLPIYTGYVQDVLRLLMARTCADNPDLVDLPRKPVTWHSLRVSFATLLFSNGCDIRSVNELMLHRSLSTTARYTPIPIEDMRRVFRTAHPRP